MSRSPNSQPGTSILLYTFGVALVATAVIVLLKGLGIINVIPGYVIWALVLLTLGIGIIGGLKNMR